MPQDVFVSYSSIDKTVADGVRRDRAAWDRVLDRPRDILPGLDWGGAIIDAISGCRVMVLVFSGNANRSQQIKREVERAVNKGVTIVPLRIEDVPLGKTLEYFISTAHWLDAFPGPLDRHMEKLAETVETLLARRPSTSVSVPRPPIPSPSPAASRQSPALEASRMPGDAAAFAGRGGGEGQGSEASGPAAGSHGARPPPLLRDESAALLSPGDRRSAVPARPHGGDPGDRLDPVPGLQGGRRDGRLRSLQATQFQNFAFAPPVAGQKSGDFSFWIRSAIPQRITLQAVLIDKEGKRSRPVPFSFDVHPAPRPATSARQRPKPRKPSFTIEAPNGMRFKVN